MINLEQARNLLSRAVATQGLDFVYNPGGGLGCYYETRETDGRGSSFPSGAPQRITPCLIGVALDLAGETRHHGSDITVYGLHSRYPDMMTLGAAAYLGRAQASQDQGSTWGKAYDAAEALAQGSGRRPLTDDGA
jgi:hypothetical protein